MTIEDERPKDEPYDFVTYAIKCRVSDDWRKIPGKRLKKVSDEEPHATLETVDRGLLTTKTGMTGAAHWTVVSKEEEREFPLYVEFASQAEEVYYTGMTERPDKRLKTHFQESNPTRVFDYAEAVEVAEVRYHRVDRSGKWLKEALQHEKSWEKQFGRFDDHIIDSAYDSVIDEISDKEELSINQIREWGRQIKDHLQGPNVKTTDYILYRLRDMKQEKERELANELTEIDDEGDQIDPKAIKTYAYWM